MATPKSAEQLAPVIRRLCDQYQAERPRLDVIARYCARHLDDIYIPKRATPEYRQLVRMSEMNVCGIVVTTIAQNLFVDGYRPTAENGRSPDSENSPVWEQGWQANRMDARQSLIHRASARYGYSYTTVVPGKRPGPGGKRMPIITPHSPRRLTAVYDDPINDEWPEAAMVIRRPPGRRNGGSGPGTRLDVYDENFRYTVVETAGGWAVEGTAFEHGLGVVPVVRYLDCYDDDEADEPPAGDQALRRPEGIPPGKVEPIIPQQRQLRQTVLGLLIAQHFQAFRQRWATGMVPDTELNAAVDAVWVNESPDGRWGEFGQVDLTGYHDSLDKILLFVATTDQVPPQNLLIGNGVSNIAAETLTALEAGHRHDVAEHKTCLGESHEQTLRLCGKVMGDEDTWNDLTAQVFWRDTTPRSLAQVADALGKLATQLGIPVQALWERIPDVTDADLDRWKEMADDQNFVGNLATALDGVGQAAGDDEAATVKAKADALGALIRAGGEFESAARLVGLEGLESSGAVPTTLRLPEDDAAVLEAG